MADKRSIEEGRDYYAGKLGDADLEDRLLENVDERRVRAICQNAIEGLATKKLNLEMHVERRVAEDRRDCYWLYIVTDCNITPTLQEPVRDPAKFEWHEVKKISHYYLSVDSIARPMKLREDTAGYGDKKI
jgi:hypothetical protein